MWLQRWDKAVCHMLTTGGKLKDLGGDCCRRQNKERQAKACLRKLEDLGLNVADLEEQVRWMMEKADAQDTDKGVEAEARGAARWAPAGAPDGAVAHMRRPDT